MICSNCQAENRETARFCRRCGTWLLPRCPFCNSPLPGAALFCDQCGRLLNTPAASFPSPLAGAPSGIQQRELPARTPEPAEQPAAPAARPALAGPAEVRADLARYIPPELMNKLKAARSGGEMVGERRVVTMLFCDVENSTAAAENLDPEEWTDIINGAFQHMISPIYKYEGTVARLMGDALLAFFGAPLAHEDDAQRAVLAGLDIIAGIQPYREEVKRRWHIDFNVRVGINTGMVVVGEVGSDLRMEYTAMGDAINLAARMEQTAEPGTVQIAHDTYKLVKPLFEFQELGGIQVKGKNEPVPAYRVLGRKVSGGRVRGIEGLRVEIVGRQDELQALGGVVADLKQGLGRLVCILGEAGLGKSRLVSETHDIFNQLVGAQGNWYEITSLSYETHQAYGLFQRLIRCVTDMSYSDAPAIIRDKLRELAASVPAARRDRAQSLFEVLFGLDGARDIDLHGDAFKRELFETVRDWWQSSFRQWPTVLVFDDMHWCDAASIELLLQLLPLSQELPLVLLCALRSERQAPAWQIKMEADAEYHHRYTELMLRPLSDAESNELLNRLLATPELPDRLRVNILEKAGGNPFFLEEVVRTLIDRGAVICEERTVDGIVRRYWRATSEGADFEIPDNLQSLLASRIDRLEDDTRVTLQIASVIGRTFYRRVLEAVDEASQELDKHVSTLIRLEMIREAARVPEVEYAFRNPLTQEAVYKTILLKRRRAFHRRVGEAIETLFPDRIERLYGLLAHHFALAGERDKAIQYWRQAARQALALYAYDDAARNLRAALDLIAVEERSEIHLALLEELGDVNRLLRDSATAIRLYEQALALVPGLPNADPLASVRLHRKIVQVVSELKWTVDLQDLQQQVNASRLEARSHLIADLPVLQAEPPNAETVRVLVALSTDAWRIQEPPDWDAAQRFAESAVSMAEQLNSPVDLSQALGALATVLDGRSVLREHLQVTERRLALCRAPEFDDVRERVDAFRGAGAARMYVGEYEQALSYLEQAENLAVEAQIVEQQAHALGLRAQCLFRLDRWDEVLALEERWRGLEKHYSRERVGET